MRSRKLALTAIEQSVIRYLATRGPVPVGKQELLDVVWGYSASVNSHTVKTTISRIRRKMGSAGNSLQTVGRRGYALEWVEGGEPPSGTSVLALLRIRSPGPDQDRAPMLERTGRALDQAADPEGFCFLDAPLHLGVAFRRGDRAVDWALSLQRALSGEVAIAMVGATQAQAPSYGGTDRDRLHALIQEVAWGDLFVEPEIELSAVAQAAIANWSGGAQLERRTPAPPDAAYRTSPVPSPLRAPSVQVELPRWHTPWLGRTDDAARLEALLKADHPVVTLLGPGGVGKTRLARRICPEGLWVDLTGVDDLDTVTQALCDRLQLGPSTPLHGIACSLGQLGTIVVLDNAEDAPAAVASLLGQLLGKVGQTRFLVTSRVALGMAGECAHRLGPLDVASARRLMCACAAAAAGREIADTNAVAQLVQRLDCMPLAIELAAGQVGLLGVQEVLERIEDRFDLLRRGEGRHGSFESVLRTSWERLNPDQQRMLTWCSTFEGPFGASEAIALVDGVIQGDPSAALTGLIQRSMVQPPQAEGSQLRLLESVRAFAKQRLSDASEETLAREAHATWAMSLVQRPEGSDETTWRKELLRRERDVMAGIRFRVGTDPGACVRAITALSCLFDMRGITAAFLAMIHHVVDATRSSDPGVHAAALNELGSACMQVGRVTEARTHLEDAVLLAQSAGDAATEVRARIALAMVRHTWGTQAYIEAIGALFPRIEATQSPQTVARVLLKTLAPLTIRRGQPETILERVSEIHRQIGGEDLGARLLLGRARVASARSDYVGTLQSAVPARALFLGLGGRVRAAYCAGLAGVAKHALGDLEGAEALLRIGVEEGRAIGVLQPTALAGLARILVQTGRLAQASEAIDELVIGSPGTNYTAIHQAVGWRNRGVIEELEGNRFLALEHYLTALEHLRAQDFDGARGVVCALAAGLLADLGQIERAHCEFARAETNGAPWFPTLLEATGARIALAESDPDALERVRSSLAAIRRSPHRLVTTLWALERILARVPEP